MKFYIVSDTHGLFSETERALREKGFFDGKYIIMPCLNRYLAFRQKSEWQKPFAFYIP